MQEELITSQQEGESPSESSEDIIARIKADPELRKLLFADADMQSEVDRRAESAAKAKLENTLKQQKDRERKRREREQQGQENKAKENRALTLHEQVERFVASLDPDESAPALRNALRQVTLKGSEVFEIHNAMRANVAKQVNSVLRELGSDLDEDERAQLTEEVTADMVDDLGSYLSEYIQASRKGTTDKVSQLEAQVKELKKELEAAKVEEVGEEMAREPSPRTLGGRREHVFTRSEIEAMDIEEYQTNLAAITKQLKAGLIK